MHPRSLLRQLTRIPLEKPCDSPWESMAGDKVRHCASCDREVYSLSDMTALEAELRLLNAADAVPCIRYARDADGQVLHLPPPARRFLSAGPTARALLAASTLMVVEAHADEKAEPTQCVMLTGLEPLAPAPAAPAAGAPAAGAPAASAPASAPAAAKTAPAPPPAEPPRPIPLAGAAPPPRQPVAFGTLIVKSKKPHDLEIEGIKMKSPLSAFRMTPGDFVMKVDGKKKKKFSIKIDQMTTIDLDKR